SDSKVTISAADPAGSGVKAIHYQWNDGPWQEHLGDSIEVYLPVIEGIHSLRAFAVDSVGNESETRTLGSYPVDYTAPQPQFTYSENNQPKPSHSVDVTLTGNRQGERGKVYYIWSSSSLKPDAADGAWTVVFNNNFWTLPMTRTIVTPVSPGGIWYLHVKTEDD